MHNPDYRIHLWNEENSPMHLPYMETAYKLKKWANLSNYMRLHALYEMGGIYLDVDIEVLRNFDPLLHNACFMGFETGGDRNVDILVNNAVLGAEPSHSFIKTCKTHLLNNFDGSERPPDCSPVMTTLLLKELGLRAYGDQLLGDIRIYPSEYFYPVTYAQKQTENTLSPTDDSYAIHHWAATWKGRGKKVKSRYTFIFISALQVLPRMFRKLLSLDFFLLSALRTLLYELEGQRRLRALTASREILHGPFRGIKYPTSGHSAPARHAMMVGSCESCLHPVIHDLLDRNYVKIYNLGCAEGYYVAGMAKLFPKALIYGYDINPLAIDLSEKMVSANNSSSRVHLFNHALQHDDLRRFDPSDRSLILCDIGGGERSLFSKDNVQSLLSADLIVELHDFVYPGTKNHVIDVFKDTHDVSIVKQTPVDFTKFPSLLPLPVCEAMKLTEEKRQRQMEWAVILSRE